MGSCAFTTTTSLSGVGSPAARVEYGVIEIDDPSL
jgi:hypothetical protein